MAVKLSSFGPFMKNPPWFSFRTHLSSLSYALNLLSIQESAGEPESDFLDFETKIRALKKALCPEGLVSILDTTHDLSSSLKLFKWATLQNRFKHTAETYKMMILKLGNAGHIEEMEGFCNEMINEKYDGAYESLLNLIHSFVHNRRLSEALRVLYVMNSNGFKPTLEIFNLLMGSVVEEKREFKDALFVYKEMVKSGVPPNIDTLNHLINALFESDRVDAAVDQYRRLEKKRCSPNIKTFRIMISSLSAKNRMQQSVAILQEMFECECMPDSSFYTCTIPLFCGIGNLEVGMKLFEMMKASNITPSYDTYIAIIKCLCDHLQVDSAIKLQEEMIDSSFFPDDLLYLDLINGFCNTNRLTEAEDLVNKRNLTDPRIHNAILAAYCESGNFTKGKDKFNKMLEVNIYDANSWNIIIRTLCDSSRIAKAWIYLCQMITHSFSPDSATFSALILGISKVGNVEPALVLYHHAISKNWVFDSISYGEFIKCLCQRRSFIEEASEVFMYMSGKGCGLDSTSLCVLIQSLCAIGDVKKAIHFLSLSDCSDKDSIFTAYNSILRGLSKSGHEIYFQVMLSRMIVAGSTFEFETYSNLIRWMSCHSRAVESAYIFSSMIRDELIPDSETLSCLLSSLCKSSEVKLLLHCVHELGSRSEVLNRDLCEVVIDCLWRKGYKSESRHFVELMLEKGWIPDVSVHGLLMGCVDVNRRRVEDNVGYILGEGLKR